MNLSTAVRRLFRIAFVAGACCLFAAALSAANAQGALGEIRARKELVIATDPTYPPFEWVEKGGLVGFDVDIGNAIGRQIGVPVRWMKLEWAGVLGALETHKCDLVMSGVTITDERKKKGFAFSRPYFLSGQAVVRRKGDAQVRSFQDLKDKIVAVQMETTGQFALEKLGVPRSQILKFDTLQEGLLDVRNGKAAAAVADMPALHENLRQGYSELEIVGGVFKEENLGVVARQSDADLLDAVNRAIEKIMVNGEYAKAYSAWIHEAPTTALLASLDRVKGDGTTPADKLPIGD